MGAPQRPLLSLVLKAHDRTPGRLQDLRGWGRCPPVSWGQTCPAMRSVPSLGAGLTSCPVHLLPPARSSEIQQLVLFPLLSCLELSERSKWKVLGIVMFLKEATARRGQVPLSEPGRGQAAMCLVLALSPPPRQAAMRAGGGVMCPLGPLANGGELPDSPKLGLNKRKHR